MQPVFGEFWLDWARSAQSLLTVGDSDFSVFVLLSDNERLRLIVLLILHQLQIEEVLVITIQLSQLSY